mgnify:CR=1 FL=1
MPKYSRTESGETIEHFDSLEELEERNRQLKPEGSYQGLFLLITASAILGYLAIQYLGLQDAAKWIKASIFTALAIPSGIIGYKYGETIIGAIILAIIGMAILGAGYFFWSLL